MALTKEQRNELFTAVTNSGINAAEFDLNLNDGAPTLKEEALWAPEGAAVINDWLIAIAHAPSTSKLLVYQISPGDHFFYRRKVGDERILSGIVKVWEHVVRAAAYWAADVKDYVDTPDLWAEMRAQRELLSEASMESLENTPFTAAEQTAISAQLHEIKNYIKDNTSLTSEQFIQVATRIDNAEAASRRLGRKDWVLLFLGTTVSLYVTDMVPAAVVQHITAMALQGLAHVLGFGVSPPPLAG